MERQAGHRDQDAHMQRRLLTEELTFDSAFDLTSCYFIFLT